MARWIEASYARLMSMAKLGQRSSAPAGRLLGPADPDKAKLRLLVIADAAGATLQINLLRPAHAAIAAGDMRMVILTEEDERLALKSGGSAQQLLRDAWQQAAPHLVFVSRYGGSLAEALLQKSADKRIPLVYHIDDNLFEVPIEAGIEKAKKYGAPARQQAIRTLLERANTVYLSTERLGEQLRKHAQLATSMFAGEIASASDPISGGGPVAQSRPRFGYMASSSHAADLQLALPGVIAGLTANSDLQFTIFGSLRPPPELAGFGPRVEHVPAVGDYDGFLSQLAAMRWDWDSHRSGLAGSTRLRPIQNGWNIQLRASRPSFRTTPSIRIAAEMAQRCGLAICSGPRCCRRFSLTAHWQNERSQLRANG